MLICVLLAMMVLVACSDDDGDDPTATTSTAVEATETTSTEPADEVETTSTPEAEATETEDTATATSEPTEDVATPTEAEDEATATEESDSGAADATAEATGTITDATPQATIEVDTEAEAALFEMALTEEDLPEGFTQVSIMPVTEIDQGLTFCNEEPFTTEEGRLASVEAEFEVDPEIGPFLLQNLTAYPEADSIDAMEYAQNVITGCDEWTDEDGVTYELTDLELPDYGDESFGVSLTLNIPEFGPVPASFAFVRVGGTLISLGYISIEEEGIVDFESIIETAVEKVEESDYRP